MFSRTWDESNKENIDPNIQHGVKVVVNRGLGPQPPGAATANVLNNVFIHQNNTTNMNRGPAPLSPDKPIFSVLGSNTLAANANAQFGVEQHGRAATNATVNSDNKLVLSDISNTLNTRNKKRFMPLKASPPGVPLKPHIARCAADHGDNVTDNIGQVLSGAAEKLAQLNNSDKILSPLRGPTSYAAAEQQQNHIKSAEKRNFAPRSPVFSSDKNNLASDKNNSDLLPLVPPSSQKATPASLKSTPSPSAIRVKKKPRVLDSNSVNQELAKKFEESLVVTSANDENNANSSNGKRLSIADTLKSWVKTVADKITSSEERENTSGKSSKNADLGIWADSSVIAQESIKKKELSFVPGVDLIAEPEEDFDPVKYYWKDIEDQNWAKSGNEVPLDIRQVVTDAVVDFVEEAPNLYCDLLGNYKGKSLVILDWDDTLFPTTTLKQLLGDTYVGTPDGIRNAPPVPGFDEYVGTEIKRRCCTLMDMILQDEECVAVIITNAMPDWVQACVERYFNSDFPLDKCPVVSAREYYHRRYQPRNDTKEMSQRMLANTWRVSAATDPWKWKAGCFTKALCDCAKEYGFVRQAIVLGDSPSDISAGCTLQCADFKGKRKNMELLKTIEFICKPNLRLLTCQLDLVCRDWHKFKQHGQGMGFSLYDCAKASKMMMNDCVSLNDYTLHNIMESPELKNLSTLSEVVVTLSYYERDVSKAAIDEILKIPQFQAVYGDGKHEGHGLYVLLRGLGKVFVECGGVILQSVARQRAIVAGNN